MRRFIPKRFRRGAIPTDPIYLVVYVIAFAFIVLVLLKLLDRI